MTAPTPGIISITMLNAHHDSHERYAPATAARTRQEYECIDGQGLLRDTLDLHRATARPRRS